MASQQGGVILNGMGQIVRIGRKISMRGVTQMLKQNFKKIEALKTDLNDITVYTFPMKVKDVITIDYVAVGGREKGAGWPVFNQERIESIKDFVLRGHTFFNAILLNWTDENHLPRYKNGYISLPIVPSAAQVIDGQHRLAGLESAMDEEESVGEKEILVSLSILLSTKQAATIFLSINSEQKPVPKSLLYDLFGEVEDDKEHALNRASDIADELNTNPTSPYYQRIKYPGMPRRVGMIHRSTVVTSLKKHLERNGVFAKLNLTHLNPQIKVILNYFRAFKYVYDKEGSWDARNKNPFLKREGFNGAIEALTETFLAKCAEKRSFTFDTFRTMLGLDRSRLLYQDEIKGLDGKSASKRVKEYLEYNLLQSIPPQEEYEF